MHHGNPLLLTNGQVAFGRYRLKMLVGKGATGVVWRARDQELDLDIALKFLAEDFLYDAAALADLKRETRRGMALSHPTIVRIFGFFQDGNHAAIAMEYVEGNTVAGLQASRSEAFFEVAEIADWIGQLCQALDYAHTDAQIVHRDLKPGNLLVDDRGRLKVADFGIAAGINDAHTRVIGSAEARGTLAYMSPQQLLGQAPCVSHDIYSLGATLYELMTGRPPFFTGDISLQVRTVVPSTIADRRREFGIQGAPIPEEWEQIVASCLDKDASRRPASAIEVAQRLRLAPGSNSTPSLPPRPASVPRPTQTGLLSASAPANPPPSTLGTQHPTSAPTVVTPVASHGENTPSPVNQDAPPTAAAGPTIRRPLLWLASGALAAVLLVGAGVGTALLLLRFRESPRPQQTTTATEAKEPAKVQREQALPASAPPPSALSRASDLSDLPPVDEPARPLNQPRPEERAARAQPVHPGAPEHPAGPRTASARPGTMPPEDGRRPDSRGQPGQLHVTNRAQFESGPAGPPLVVEGLGLTLMYIPEGGCRVGAPPHATELPDNEKPASEVHITRGFWLGAKEVSRGEYRALMGSVPRALPGQSDQHPVTNVNWTEASAFCEKLTAREAAAGRLQEGFVYALPPEAYWEYALKNGSDGPSAPYRSLQGASWGRAAATAGPQPCGKLTPTPWGLHDMYGNVAEWTADWYAPKLSGGVLTDPRGPARGTQRVYRGGYYDSGDRDLRPSSRWGMSPTERSPFVGFRVALIPRT